MARSFFHFLRVVHKVHDHDLFIKGRAYTVQAGKRLHRIYTTQLFQHIHGAELRLVETDLILICHQQNVILVPVKHLRQLILSKAVHARFGVFGIFNFHLAGERYQRLYILVIMPGDISFDAAQIPVLCGAASAHQKFKLLGFLWMVWTLRRFPAQTGERRGDCPNRAQYYGQLSALGKGLSRHILARLRYSTFPLPQPLFASLFGRRLGPIIPTPAKGD